MLYNTTFARTSVSTPSVNAERAAETIHRNFAGQPAALVVYFSSTDYDPQVLSRRMYELFPGTVTIGATAAGEGMGGKLFNDAVVAMAFAPEVFEHCSFSVVVGAGQAVDPGRGVFATVDEGMASIADGLGKSPLELDYREHVGFMLADTISWFSEAVVERLGELSNVIFVGGVAGDDYKFIGEQRVMYNGEVYQTAVIMGLMKPKRGFELLKTQAVEVSDKVMTITRADEKERIIWEFDGQPAAGVYSRLTGVPEQELDIFTFDEYPLALLADGEPYLRSTVKRIDGGGLQMFAMIKEGMRMVLTRAGDVCSTTARALKEKRAAMGSVAAILHINCASRATALKNRNQAEEFGELFGGLPSISLSSYGEIYVGLVALTSSMILFK